VKPLAKNKYVYREGPPEAVYLKRSQVAKLVGVPTSTIEHWQRYFGEATGKRDGRGHRLYSQKSLLKFEHIYQLVKIEGYTLEGAKRKLK
jgi:DNA-binding transcriptional MerR regulator